MKDWKLILSQVLDFGASRDGVPKRKRGRRIVVNVRGEETAEVDVIPPADPDDAAAAT